MGVCVRDSCATREPPIGWGGCPSRLLPTHLRVASRRARGGAGEAGGAKLAGGVAPGAGPGRCARHGLRPRPRVPTRLSPPPPPCPAARSVLTPRSTPRPRCPARGSPALAACARAPRISRARSALPTRARAWRTDTRSFPLAPSALGGGGGRTTRGHTVAAAAGWPAGHGGRWGWRADETATHPGNQQGEGAAGGGVPGPRGVGRGEEARSEADKGGGAEDVAVWPPRPGPGAPPPPGGRRGSPSPLFGGPGRGGEGRAAASRGGPSRGGRQRAARILATRLLLGAAGARPPQPLPGPRRALPFCPPRSSLIPVRPPNRGRQGSPFRWPGRRSGDEPLGSPSFSSSEGELPPPVCSPRRRPGAGVSRLLAPASLVPPAGPLRALFGEFAGRVDGRPPSRPRLLVAADGAGPAAASFGENPRSLPLPRAQGEEEGVRSLRAAPPLPSPGAAAFAGGRGWPRPRAQRGGRRGWASPRPVRPSGVLARPAPRGPAPATGSLLPRGVHASPAVGLLASLSSS